MQYPLLKPKYYYSLFKDIVEFVKRPKQEQAVDKSTKFKIYDTIGLYLLKMVCLIPVVLFFAFIYDPENIQSVDMSKRFSPLVFLLVGGLILPLVEETAFRLSLKFKPIYLTLSSSVLLYYILTKAVFFTKVSAIDESFMTRIVAAVAFGLVLYPLINIEGVKKKLSSFWVTHFHWIYYISCLLFAWVHIYKYELILVNILLIPILTLPQLMSAIIYGYTRVSFGFQYPLLFHMATNLMAIGLSFLAGSDLLI